MKVIDLLNKIANEQEVPNCIYYGGLIFKWTGLNYYCNKTDEYLDNHICIEDLEQFVDIVAEDKKIEEIKSLNNVGNSKDLIEFSDKQQLNNHILKDKINELVREVNRINESK